MHYYESSTSQQLKINQMFMRFFEHNWLTREKIEISAGFQFEVQGNYEVKAQVSQN